MYGISSSGKEAIAIAVEKMFDALAYKLLGNIPKLRNKPFFGSSPVFSLAHIFIQALGGKDPNHIERDVLRSILNSSYGYIESLKNKTSSNIAESVDALVKEAKVRNSYVTANQVTEIISSEMEKARNNMKLIAEAETTKTRNMAHTMEIVGKAKEQGVEDPTVFFIIVRDGQACSECVKLHMMDDGVTPKTYKMSEISMGWHKRGDDRPSACGEHPHCFTGSQLLYTQKGLYTFEELFISQENPNVLVDFRVKNKKFPANQYGKPILGSSWLDLHSKERSKFLIASNVYDTGIQNILKLTLDSGHVIEVTEDHEMWTEVGNTQWIKKSAKNLCIEDKVPLITKGESFGMDHFPLEAELMGNLMGDGHINKNTDWAEWCFFGNDIEYGQKLYSMLKEKYPDPRFLNEMTVFPPNDKYAVESAGFRSVRIGRIFKNEFEFTKNPHRIPKRLFKADKETVAAFLRGLYAADGHSEPNNAVLGQSDLILLQQIQLLLSMFGLISRIYKHGEKHDKIITYANGDTFNTHRRESWRLMCTSKNQFKKFLDEIGFGVPKKQEKAINNIVEFESNRNAWYTAKIEKIESLGEEQTYCLTEPISNTVTVNGIVTGQCRCSISQLPPGWGFKNGFVSFIALGYDEYKAQRGLD